MNINEDKQFLNIILTESNKEITYWNMEDICKQIFEFDNIKSDKNDGITWKYIMNINVILLYNSIDDIIEVSFKNNENKLIFNDFSKHIIIRPSTGYKSEWTDIDVDYDEEIGKFVDNIWKNI